MTEQKEWKNVLSRLTATVLFLENEVANLVDDKALTVQRVYADGIRARAKELREDALALQQALDAALGKTDQASPSGRG